MTYSKTITSIAIAVAFGAASCASNPSTSDSVSQTKSASGNSSLTAKANASNATAIPAADMQITLYCYPVTGIDHVAQSKLLKDQVTTQTGLSGFYIVHNETDSVLYHGYYKDFMSGRNPQEKARAEADRQKIVKVTDRRGDQPFRGATFVNIDTPEPEGPAEWNLANTPIDRMWSWQIAAYVESPLRKQYAVDAVREARAQGIEAYYYHGENISSVCIGAFPAEALKAQDSEVQNRAMNSDRPLVVLPMPLPAGIKNDGYIIQDGKRVQADIVVARAEVLDPKLLEIQRMYPLHLVNGEEIINVSKDPRTGRQSRVPARAHLVHIPRKGDQVTAGQQPGAGNLSDRMLTAPTNQRRNTGADHLRGIGE